jgi:hypothetical protein
MNVGRGNPRNVFVELKTGKAAVKVRGQMQGQNEGKKRNHQREHPNVPVSPRKKQQQHATDSGRERDQRQNVVIEPVHGVRSPTQTM